MKITKLNKVLDVLLKADLTPMIIGHHGIGKTTTIKEYAKQNDYEFVSVRLGNMVDAGDLLGLGDFVLDESGNKIATKFFAPDWFPRESNSKGIIVLDEINRVRSSSILQAVFSLAEPRFIGGRRLHTHILPEGWRVVAMANPPTDDYDVIDVTDAAFVDRFCYIKLEAGPNEHREYMRKHKFNQTLIDFSVQHESLCYPIMKPFDLNFVKPSNRSIEFMNKVMNITDDKNIIKQISMGVLGVEATVALDKFLSDNSVSLSVSEILSGKNYKKIELLSNTRLDIIGLANEKLLSYLFIDDNKLDKTGVEGLKSYFKLIPKDLYWDFLSKLLHERSGEIKNITNLSKFEEVIETGVFTKEQISKIGKNL